MECIRAHNLIERPAVLANGNRGFGRGSVRKMETVQIRVVDGVAFIDHVPPGITVEVHDFDVYDSPTRDASGQPFSAYRVEGEARRRTRKAKASDGGKGAVELFALGQRIVNGERPWETK
jgi:hypothetical protein